VPHVLINPEGGDVLEAGLVIGHGLEQRLDRAPHRVPGRAELPGEAPDRGVLTSELSSPAWSAARVARRGRRAAR
jgi:hypothetical protein